MKITVCIPTLEAADKWPSLWASLVAQKTQPSEVIVVDSSSTDGTSELAQRSGCRVVSIPRSEFRHGGTRQFAAEIAGEVDVVVYLTQDLILADSNSLTRLVEAFDDASVGAAYGRQLPRSAANPIEAHARLFNYPAVSGVRSIESVSAIGIKAVFFSNSFGAYRKDALNEVGGFPRAANFGEDTVVAARILQRGARIAYVADAVSYHSHALSHFEELMRYFRIGQLHGSEAWLSREFGEASGEGRKFAISELRYLLRHAPWHIPDAALRTGLKYLAYKTGKARARSYTRRPHEEPPNRTKASASSSS